MADLATAIVEITIRSLLISSTATLLASIWSIPISIDLAVKEFRWKHHILSFVNAMVGVPTVILGLLIYMILSSKGPLGVLNLLYTPYGIIIGEAVLITPLMVSIAHDSIKKVKDFTWELALSLGSTEKQAEDLLIREATPELVTAIIISFGRALGELGVALMVGGNIKGYTRVFTTAIALEVTKGNFEFALVLGLILLLIVSIVAVVLRFIGARNSD